MKEYVKFYGGSMLSTLMERKNTLMTTFSRYIQMYVYVIIIIILTISG